MSSTCGSNSTKRVEHAPPLDGAIARVLAVHSDAFRAFLRKRLDNDFVAEDLLQNCFVKAVDHPPKTREELGILRWFYTVLKTSLIDHYRAESTEREKVKSFVLEIDAISEKVAVSADDHPAQVCQCMSGVLDSLKPEYSEVLRAVDLNEELPHVVAQRSAITVGNLNVRLHRARIALKHGLESSCGTCAGRGCLNCTCGT